MLGGEGVGEIHYPTVNVEDLHTLPNRAGGGVTCL